MSRLLRFGLLAVLLITSSTGLQAQVVTMETDDLRLVYQDFTTSFIAEHAARCFQNSYWFYEKLYDFKPSEKVTVFIEDSADYNNAAAWSSPRNSIIVKLAPTNRVYETNPSNERLNHTLNHEMMHIVDLDQNAGRSSFFRSIFQGKVRATEIHPETIVYEYLTSPRRAAPRWYHEGIAVFMETWMAGGQGRAQGAYDEMVFRSMVRDGTPFYDPLGIESEGTQVDFQVGVNSYLYGTRFHSWLAYTYSPQHIVEWTGRSSESNKGYYASQFKKVFGKSLGEAWDEWVQWEHDFQNANLEAVRKYPITPFQEMGTGALGSVSRSYYDSDTKFLYAGLNYPGTLGYLARIDTETGQVERLTDIPGAAIYFVCSLAFDSQGKTLFYTANNNEYRDIHAYDLNTGKSRRLLNDLRIGDLAFNQADSSLWGIRHYNGLATLVKIPHPYEEWIQVHSYPYGMVPYDIDISPDGSLLSYSFSERDGTQTLRASFTDKLLAGDTTPIILYDFGSSLPGNFVFSPDGDYLYGSSYYTGVSNIWRYNFDADSMEVVSNCETGLFRPVPTWGDSIIAYSYSGEGFVPGTMLAEPLQDVSEIVFFGNEIVEKHPVVEGWNVGSPTRNVNLNEVVTHWGPYRALGQIGITSVYPVVQGYRHITPERESEDYAAVGLHVDMMDPGYIYTIGLTASYTPSTSLPKDERLHAHLSIQKGRWTADVEHNAANFYDLFGPTRTSRRANSIRLGYERVLVDDPPRSLGLYLSTSGYNNLVRLPDAQNVSASFDKLWRTSAVLGYQNLKASLGATDVEKGISWNVSASNNYVNRRTFPKLLANLNVGTPLFSHSSIWLRTAAGIAPGDRDEPFANFFFGGFGNNWVDHGSIKRYRSVSSFPGLDLNKLHGPLGQIGGTNFAKVILDWNLPPLRFRRVGIPSFYVTWARASLFTSGLATNVDNPGGNPRGLFGNVGGQTDFRFTLLSHLNMTLSLGYAIAFDRFQSPDNEFMFSLKVL